MQVGTVFVSNKSSPLVTNNAAWVLDKQKIAPISVTFLPCLVVCCMILEATRLLGSSTVWICSDYYQYEPVQTNTCWNLTQYKSVQTNNNMNLFRILPIWTRSNHFQYKHVQTNTNMNLLRLLPIWTFSDYYQYEPVQIYTNIWSCSNYYQ